MPALRDPRIVKIFFSSPFGGMENEREELTKRYFPQIHHLCNRHGLQFAAVDMRWGITAESSESAQVINICLREIDRSDMFVGFFGQRYGWHGANDAVLQNNFNTAVGRYPWLDSYRDKSVTELEFLHGFLNNPGHLPATLFFRDKAYDDMMREEGVKSGDKKQMFKYSPESELSVQLMDDLKLRVLAERDKSLGVHMDYTTPAEAAAIMFDTIMTFLKDKLLTDVDEVKLSERQELLSQHDAFLSSRSNIYVGGDHYLSLLDDQLMAGQGQHVMVVGEAGSGKSALLCNWITKLKQNPATYVVVYHFVGFAQGSSTITSMLERFVTEFQHACGDDSRSQTERPTSDQQDHARILVHDLQAAISELVSLSKVPILVIDGLDKVAKEKIGKVLYWLPKNLPSTCRVVVSTQMSDTENFEELKSREYLLVQIESLSQDSQRDMSIKTLQESGKEMSPHQLDRIIVAEMTKLPLFLKITLTELISFGYFRLLDKKIDSLISSVSVEELLKKVLERFEDDYNVEDYHGNLVEQVMCCITMSHQGLAESELKEMFQIPDHVWSPLYFAMEKLIVNQSGRIQFGFKELTDAVNLKYLVEPDRKTFYLKKMISHFTTELDKKTKPNFALTQRSVSELPWLWLQLGDKAGLLDCITNFTVFEQQQLHNTYNLVSFWRETGTSGQEMVNRLLASFDNFVALLYTELEERSILGDCITPGMYCQTFLQHVDNFLDMTGFHMERERVIRRNIKILKDGLQHTFVRDREGVEEKLCTCQYKLACLFSQTPHKEEEGIRLHKEILEQVQSKLGDQKPSEKMLMDMGHSYHGIGVGYVKLNQFEQGIEYFKKSIECHEKTDDRNKLREMASSYSNIALSLLGLERPEEALEHFELSIKTYEDYFFGEVPPVVGEILTNKAMCLRRLERYDEAEETYFKSLEIKTKAFGTDHIIVAMAYMNLGALESYRSNDEKALVYNRRAVEICETVGLTWDTLEYIRAKENILGNLGNLERYHEMDKDFLAVLDWRIADGSMDGCIASIYEEMAKFYIREERYHDAYKVVHALLGSKHGSKTMYHVYMDMIVSHLPPEVREKLPQQFTITHAVEQDPGNVAIIKYHVETNLIPAGDEDETARLINRLHSLSDVGADVYTYTCAWCEYDGKIQENCQRRMAEEGLIQYPDNLELLLVMAKSYRRENRPDAALPFCVRVLENQSDNFPLMMLTMETAALAGQYETSLQYCQVLLGTCTDDNLLQKAAHLKKLVEETQRAQDNNDDNTENNQNDNGNNDNSNNDNSNNDNSNNDNSNEEDNSNDKKIDDNS